MNTLDPPTHPPVRVNRSRGGSRPFIFWLALACIWIGVFSPPAIARTPIVTKLLAPPASANGFDNFGNSVAVSDRWILVGVAEGFSGNGSARVYDARTGRHLRVLRAVNGSPGSGFGTSVAVCGSLGLVGAYFEGGGAAYLFDLRTGRQLHRLVPNGGEGGAFGISVALSGHLALVGADQHTGGGAAWVFDTRTGQQVAKLTASDAAGGDDFGNSVSLSGSLALIGARRKNSDTGAAYVFDARTGEQLHQLTPSGGLDPGDGFGFSVSLSGNRALIGATRDDDAGNNAGAAYVFDVSTGQQLGKLLASDASAGLGNPVSLSGHLALIGGNGGKAYLFDVASGAELRRLLPRDTNSSFATSLALCGSLAVIGAPGDDQLANEAGAAYFYRPLAQPLPLETLAQTRDFAPGTVEADFRAFTQPSINGQGEVAFAARLMGPGSNANRDHGIWWNEDGAVTSLVAKSRDAAGVFGPGVTLGSVQPPTFDQNGVAVFQTTLAGAGVNATNNRALLARDGNTLVSLLRTGDAPPSLGGAQIAGIHQVAQRPGQDPNAATVAYTLRRGAIVSAANDSGVLLVDNTGAVIDALAREGQPLPGINPAATYRQSMGRVTGQLADPGQKFAFATFVQIAGDSGARQAVIGRNAGTGSPSSFQAQFSSTPTGPAGERFGALLGEALTSAFGNLLVRAVVSGTGVTLANNEGLWLQNTLLIRKGEAPDPAQPAVVISRFLRVWPVAADSAVVLVKLAGPGVNPGNDCALYWRRHTTVGTGLVKLIREGDAVGDWDCPTVGVIQRVEVNPETGQYAVVASLTGSPVRNQALFTGSTGYGSPGGRDALREATLALRKGTLYNTSHSESTRLRSLVLEPRNDRGGFGGKGLGQVVNPLGSFVMVLQFDDRAVELVTGKP